MCCPKRSSSSLCFVNWLQQCIHKRCWQEPNRYSKHAVHLVDAKLHNNNDNNNNNNKNKNNNNNNNNDDDDDDNDNNLQAFQLNGLARYQVACICQLRHLATLHACTH